MRTVNAAVHRAVYVAVGYEVNEAVADAVLESPRSPRPLLERTRRLVRAARPAAQSAAVDFEILRRSR